MKILFILSVLFTSTILNGQQTIDNQRLALDDSLNIAVFQIQDSVFSNERNLTWKGLPLKLSGQDSVMTATINNKTYKAYNTILPLITIDAPNGIVNEPKRMSSIHYADSSQALTSFAGIELRGSSSQFFPKKTYDINFHEDSAGAKNRDLKFGSMRKDDDWILDGLYNEPLRLRSHISLALWKKIHKPAYLDKEPKAQSGVETHFCEVFVNGHYKGIYLLSEQVDRKLLKLAKEDSTGVRGELFQGSSYDGAVTFDSIPPKKNFMRRWGGYDIEYPYPSNIPWDNLYPFTQVVVNGDKTAFAKAVKEQLQLDNIIDYFLFVNAVRAPDNLGKNIYLARYDTNEPYFYVPWDLDGTFGTVFSGKRVNKTTDFLTNGLLRRLLADNPEDFIARFKERWTALRNTTLQTEFLVEWQEKEYHNLIESGAYEREQRAWTSFNSEKEQLDYMTQWTKKRLEFLDTYIADLVPKTD